MLARSPGIDSGMGIGTTIFVITSCKTRVKDYVNDCVNDVLLAFCIIVHKIVPK